MTDHRLANLHATVGFLQLPPRAPALQLLHRWLDSRYGLGLMVEGMTRQGSDLQARDWRADFLPVGIAHSIVGGSAWERTPWHATQRAAWEALRSVA